MQSKHIFRLSALMAALAVAGTTPAFAYSSAADTSFADSMAVGGDTSTTYQRQAAKTPEPQALAQAPAVDEVAQAPIADADQAPLAAAALATPASSAAGDSSAVDQSVASTDSIAVAGNDAPSPDDVLMLIASDDAGTPTIVALLTDVPSQPALPPAAPQPAIAGITTREQVRDELRIARASGTLSKNGELADTSEVLTAREQFNVAQTEAIVAEYRAEQERQLALAAAEESRRAQVEADALELGVMAAMAGDEPLSDVRIEVIDISGE